MPKFSLIRSREVFFPSGINSLYRGKNYLYRGNRSKPFELAVVIDFGLKFEFARYLAVYRGIPPYRYPAVKT
jgi:hypothetical protein